MNSGSSDMDERDLIFDWNLSAPQRVHESRPIELNDETLRDGLQSPSVVSPTIDQKVQILHYLPQLGIQSANIGLPGAGPIAKSDVMVLAREIRDHHLPVAPNCAARTLIVDIDPIVEASDHAGTAIEASVFIGSSPIRQYAEGWTLDRIIRHSVEAVEYAVSHDLPVMFVTEDTTRAHPEALRALYTAAMEAGAGRICLADTVGHVTPEGVWNLVTFIKQLVADVAPGTKIDWHGHNDRGLGVVNTLTAAFAGVDRIHGTAIGIGERVGNTAIDQILVNFKLLGWIDNDLSVLGEYCDFVSRVTEVPIPANYPVLGTDAFRTATGVHAAAVIKALRKGHDWLANRVYSGVPADYFGRHQIIEIGPMSGQSNVIYWLESRGITPHPDLVEHLFLACKQADRILSESEILSHVATWSSQAPSAPVG